MPYFVHAKTESPDSGVEYVTKERAARAVQPGQTITFCPFTAEARGWRLREQRRLDDGTYSPVPWAGATWESPDRFVHVSYGKAGYVAYTPSEEFGCEDRQLRCRAGRYLKLFAPHLSENVRREMVEQLKGQHTQLQVAYDPETIEAVYTHSTTESCMRYPAGHYSSPCHPVCVYGNSDLAVAYLGDAESRTHAHAVIWPDKKIFNRVHGDSTLRAILEAHGYHHGSLEGARVRAIAYDGTIVLPFIDNMGSASVRGRWVVLFEDDELGTFGAQPTGGLAEPIDHPDCLWCNDPISPRSSGEMTSGGPVCDHCAAHDGRRCIACADLCHVDDFVAGSHVCEGCTTYYRDCPTCHRLLTANETCPRHEEGRQPPLEEHADAEHQR